MNPLIIGKNGQLAFCLSSLNSRSIRGATFWGRDELNWLEPDDHTEKILNFKPSHIINTSAYTAVDAAELHQSDAFRVNATGPEILAHAAKRLSVPLIHISTDYVFDGNASRPYTADQPCHPLNVYGASKLDGEIRVKESGCHYVIIRSSWVFSETGSNFVSTMMGLNASPELSVVNDQIGRPTYAGDLAKLIASILDSDTHLDSGTYHYSGGDQVTWFEFADAIFDTALRHKLINSRPTLIPTTTNRFQSSQRANGKTVATRPLFGVLNHSPELSDFAPIGNWRDSLPNVITTLTNRKNG
ncbi:MAG: dTDP-4-dehydrorhamnose reductase [Pseudomonadales bacterium]